MNKKNILLFVIILFFISSGFYNNSYKVVKPEFYKHWQQIFESLVVGRLSLSQQEGVFSAGGLLVLGNADELEFQSKTINYQYDSYKKGGKFDRYWAYKSSPAIGGVLLSIMDQITNFSPGFTLKIFRMGVSFFNGIIFSFLILWFYLEIGWLAALLNLLLIHFSPWLTLAGGSIYWQLWAFYLPLVVNLFWLRHLSNNKEEYPSLKIQIGVFTMVLAKILFTGFEFITAFLLMTTVPFIFYALKNKWGFLIFFRRVIKIAFNLLGALFAGLFVLAFQIMLAEGSFLDAVRYIFYAFGKRSFGGIQSYPEPYASAIESSVFSVIRTYLTGPVFSRTSFPETNIASPSWGGSYLLFIFLIAFFSIILALLIKFTSQNTSIKMRTALLLTTWYSIFAPLSWFIIFKAHAYLHPTLDFLVWQMPFMFFGLALIGSTISLLYKRLFQTKKL